MGSPLSPVVANMVMQDFEKMAIGMLPCRLLFYYRYVDDIILAAPSESICDILDIFNSLHIRLQFTMEIGLDGKISFLDTMLIIEERNLIFDIYRKATFSGRFLNFHSHHPLCHKRDIIYGVVDKIFCLCHPKFQRNNLIDAIKIFLQNRYPLRFIFSTIHNRIKYHINKINNLNKNKDDTKRFFMIPYVNTISERFILLLTCLIVN